MKSKYLMIGAAVCAALFLFSGVMLYQRCSIKKSTCPTKGHCGLHTELICHRYNETNALARRNLSLCRCVFIICGISTFYSVGCRSPPDQSESQKIQIDRR